MSDELNLKLENTLAKFTSETRLKGVGYYMKSQVTGLAFLQNKIAAAVKGSSQKPYQVLLDVSSNHVKNQCTCPNILQQLSNALKQSIGDQKSDQLTT